MFKSLLRIGTVLLCAFAAATGVAFAAEGTIPPIPGVDQEGSSESNEPPSIGTSKPERPHVVRVRIKRPKPIRKVRRFKPWATPSPEKVKQIIIWEQQRWGGPSLMGRVWCESKYLWHASNGQYRGVLQFGPIWSSMWPGTPRDVKIVKKTTVKRHKIRITRYSDGTRKRKKLRKVKVPKTVILKGKLPKNPSPFHAWAAIRVGQRAVSGHGPTTSWECNLDGTIS